MSTKMEDIIKANGHDKDEKILSKAEMQAIYKRAAGKVVVENIGTNQLPAPNPIAVLLYVAGIVIALAFIAVIGMHVVDYIFFMIGVK